MTGSSLISILDRRLEYGDGLPDDEASQHGRRIAGAPLVLFYCFVDGRDLEGASIIDSNLALNNAIDHLYWASLSRDFPSPSHLDPSKSM